MAPLTVIARVWVCMQHVGMHVCMHTIVASVHHNPHAGSTLSAIVMYMHTYIYKHGYVHTYMLIYTANIVTPGHCTAHGGSSSLQDQSEPSSDSSLYFAHTTHIFFALECSLLFADVYVCVCTHTFLCHYTYMHTSVVTHTSTYTHTLYMRIYCAVCMHTHTTRKHTEFIMWIHVMMLLYTSSHKSSFSSNVYGNDHTQWTPSQNRS